MRGSRLLVRTPSHEPAEEECSESEAGIHRRRRWGQGQLTAYPIVMLNIKNKQYFQQA
jgi:hypothetical protein